MFLVTSATLSLFSDSTIILIRFSVPEASGTENLIRIMVESENKDKVAEVTKNIADKIIEQNDILKNK